MTIIVDNVSEEYYQILLTQIMLICNNCKISILPEKCHGRLIDESKITQTFFHKEHMTDNNMNILEGLVFDKTDAPTVAEPNIG